MERIFSGRVSGQGSLESVDDIGASSLNHTDMDEDDIATPYVYIYRRMDGR